jgi:hypothetical protein
MPIVLNLKLYGVSEAGSASAIRRKNGDGPIHFGPLNRATLDHWAVTFKDASSVSATPNKSVPQTDATRDEPIDQAIIKTGTHSGYISFSVRSL